MIKVIKYKDGFTLIEVILFLAVTGMMFTGLVVNTHNNISKQRYNASVQELSSFLRRVYSEAENVQIYDRDTIEAERYYCTLDSGADMINGRKLDGLAGSNRFAAGRSECAVYGKLIIFGESDAPTIHVYDVIGDIVDAKHPLSDTSSEIAAYKAIHMGILMLKDKDTSRNLLITSSYSHTLEWGAKVENTLGDDLVGAILIVRSPLSGVMHTFVRHYDATENGRKKVDIAGMLDRMAIGPLGNASAAYNSIVPSDLVAKFSSSLDGFSNRNNTDICVESDDRAGMNRRNIRILADAHSSADIILIAQDDASPEGNKCIE